MLKKNKPVNGFKFSFKEDITSSQSTPKFTSIQLTTNTLHHPINQLQLKKQSLLPRGVDRKIKNKSKPQSTGKIKKMQTVQSARNLYFHEQANKSAKSLKDIQTQKLIHSFRKQYKNGRNTQSKKVIVMNKGKIQLKQREQHRNQFFQASTPYQEQKKPTTKSSRRALKKQDKQQQILLEDQSLLRAKKNKTRQLSLNVKKQQFTLTEIPDKIQSPKSLLSQRNMHKQIKYLSTNFCTNKKQAQILETGVFPQTQKSRRLLTQSGERDNKMCAFFKRHDTKKSLIASKNLFKSQKSNLNVRLNNMGSGISKLNIFIQ